jgi:hypothetical protein
MANGDVLIILDADMTVAPEDLPRFYLAIAEGTAGFANGSRFAYPMEAGAMPALNSFGNHVFSRALSWLTRARLTDTLCGTKSISAADWSRVAKIRPIFGNHDPWGDFDLLMGAAYIGLDIRDVPVRYYARSAGESKMRPLRHGVRLLRTCVTGFMRLRFGPRSTASRVE